MKKKKLFIKEFLPETLFGRFLLIIVVPTLVVQLVAIYMFYHRHWEGVSHHMALSLVGDIAAVYRTIAISPPDERDRIIDALNKTLYLKSFFKKGQLLGTEPKKLPSLFIIDKEGKMQYQSLNGLPHDLDLKGLLTEKISGLSGSSVPIPTSDLAAGKKIEILKALLKRNTPEAILMENSLTGKEMDDLKKEAYLILKKHWNTP